MQAVNRPFNEIIDGKKQFVIPVFQRDFSWTQEQFQQLWRDVGRTSNKHAKGHHFLGSIVYVSADLPGVAFGRWLLIDGQQRMTTLTLLMIALRDHIRKQIQDGKWSAGEESPTIEQIDAYYLKNMQESGQRRYKLLLRRKDNATLQALIDGKDTSELEGERSDLLIEAYDFFRSELDAPTCDPDNIYRGIARLGVVDVTLDRGIDNPQLVFESMNSTGIALRQSDLVRNYLLMSLDDSEQTRLYEEYWKKVESFFRTSESALDWFLRDYMALERRLTQQIRLDRVYDEFKSFWRHDGGEPLEDLLIDMVRVARAYSSFLGIEPMEPRRVAHALSRMRSLNTTQGVLVMQLHDCYQKDQLSEDEFVDAVELIESYLLRRAVLGLQTRGYWSVFARIAHNLKHESAFESLQVAMARLSGSSRFPSDEEFSRGLKESDLYGLRVCKHILDWLENSGHLEPSPVQDYSIEHIMPQAIREVHEWRQMLGEDWEKSHATHLHRLGNLTLTAYNSTYSNLPFEKKKDIPGGFRQSAVRLNSDVRDEAQWTSEEILVRGERLAKRALEIWPYHEADAAQIQIEEVRELRERAAMRSVNSLEIDDNARGVLDSIRETIGGFADIIEVIEHKSVCCYGPEFFAELLPMKGWVRVILPLEFNEVEKPDGLTVQDASTWTFVPNRMHTDSDLLVDVWEMEDIAAVSSMIRQALDRSRQ